MWVQNEWKYASYSDIHIFSWLFIITFIFSHDYL
jgi:hypothetical protein